MARDMYFRDDILNVLRSAHVAGDGASALVAELRKDPHLSEVPVETLVRVYRSGFNRALVSVGLALGLASGEPGIGAARDALLSDACPPDEDAERADMLKAELLRILWPAASSDRR